MNWKNGIRAPVLGIGALSISVGFQPPIAKAQNVANLFPPAPVSSAKTNKSDRTRVSFGDYGAGTIVVRTKERRLYYVTGNGEALKYTVGVGRLSKQWSGRSAISGKYIKPAWSPPEEIRHDKPGLPSVIPGGAPNNPMGAAAMTLAGGEYAIHGTNQPGSIGGFVSYGCIRMRNADILDLFGRVSIGTPVIVER